ncbi:putative surface protein with fasciclin (FAS1) repeats [Hephaestia caeni]|uniref:Putative surface protein with fasciclin (FAS1) repeats n=1 Tax=Hephaestia caeni TaxID=645617 RepID=A0A397PCU4_9SPHN|nr:fasciclin domain-containing protein [Hephaestia caeni]RIA46862.1 putative surface protein with fasciclin (FAS1) repeats [Hephaestia caeni]
MRARRILSVAVTLAVAGCASAPTPVKAPAPPPNPTVGGVAMIATWTAVDNARAAPPLATFARAIDAAGLADTLAATGPFTVFAPTDTAFGRLAPGTLDALLLPENKPALAKLVTYHVVPGRLTVADLKARIAAGGGTATLTTLEGEPLTLGLVGTGIALTDVGGNKSYVETGDIREANGMMHVVNGIMIPTIG